MKQIQIFITIVFFIVLIMDCKFKGDIVKYSETASDLLVTNEADSVVFYTYFHISSYYSDAGYHFEIETKDGVSNCYLTCIRTIEVNNDQPNFTKRQWGGFRLAIPDTIPDKAFFWYRDKTGKYKIPYGNEQTLADKHSPKNK